MRRGVAAIPHAPSARDMIAPRSAQRRHSNRLTPTGLTKVDSVTARAHSLPSAEVMATSLDVDIETVRPSLELLHLTPRRPRDRERWLRRRLNTAVAAVALVVASPLLLLIAVLIKLTSRGPVLFRQTRIGLDRRALSRAGGNTRRRLDQGGHPFIMYKFRTMRLAVQRDPQVWAQPDDARVTPIGRVLRKFRLDELPQLFNVLRGDMNIVGPRPEQPAIFVYLREQIEGYQRRQRVRPGITGWAQVNQGYDQSVEDVRRKVAYDLEYIRRQSALEDLRIMLRTIPVMVFRRGGW
jgi:lipopolysaccharide/colanic/teichoic acid biosynthesis glycosyltransferase